MGYTPTQPGIDTSGIGVDNVQALTLFDSQPSLPEFAVAADQDQSPQDQPGNPHLVLIGLIGALIGLNYLAQHVTSSGILGSVLRFTIVTLTVIVSVVILKVFFTKYPVPGVTQLVHAI
jgi:hypothetical protein